MIKYLKEKIIARLGSFSGIAGILGSWQVCHNICLGLIALLSIMGITIVGMPLGFLAEIVVPVWSAAFILLLITTFLYFKKKCISRNLLIFNTGLILAGIPFFKNLSILFWIVGGSIAFTGIFLFIKERIRRRKK